MVGGGGRFCDPLLGVVRGGDGMIQYRLNGVPASQVRGSWNV